MAKLRWATKEEAKEYIDKCFKTQNFGLSYCAACDYVGLVPNEHKEYIKHIYLGIWADCLFDIKALINEIKYEIYNAEYVENHKFKDLDCYLASNEEYLKVAVDELKFIQSLDKKIRYRKRRKRYGK